MYASTHMHRTRSASSLAHTLSLTSTLLLSSLSQATCFTALMPSSVSVDMVTCDGWSQAVQVDRGGTCEGGGTAQARRYRRVKVQVREAVPVSRGASNARYKVQVLQMTERSVHQWHCRACSLLAQRSRGQTRASCQTPLAFPAPCSLP